MTDPTEPEPPPTGVRRVLTRDPVLIVWVCYGLIQAVVTVLIGAEVISPIVSAVVTGVALAIYVAVSELFVHHETVPLQPLREYAAAIHAHTDGPDP